MKKDLTYLIERVEPFEQRLNVELSGLYATSNDDDDMISVRGEIRCSQGDTLIQSVKLTVTVFDSAGRVLETEDTYIDNKNFFGFELFDIDIWVSGYDVAKLRLHPSPYDSY